MIDDAIKSEMLAEKFVDDVKEVTEQLKKGKVDLCLNKLEEIVDGMEVTLALGERDDIHDGEVVFH